MQRDGINSIISWWLVSIWKSDNLLTIDNNVGHALGITWLWSCELSCKQVTRTAIPIHPLPLAFSHHRLASIHYLSPIIRCFFSPWRFIITFLSTPYTLLSSAGRFRCLVNPTDLHTRGLSVLCARLTLSASRSSSNFHLTGLSRFLGTVWKVTSMHTAKFCTTTLATMHSTPGSIASI